jgi:hypothetical protein
MDTNEGPARQSADDLLNEALDHAKASAARSGGHEARLERLEEYELAGATKADPLEALLTFVNADLLNIAYRLGDALKESLSAAPLKAEGVQLVAPTLNDLLRVTRQIDRFAHLETRITNARVPAEVASNHSPSTAKHDDAQRPPRRAH